jgi:hypothetical protein
MQTRPTGSVALSDAMLVGPLDESNNGRVIGGEFPLDIMLLCVRWYVAYALSLRNLEEIMQERGLFVDHSTIHRWVIITRPIQGFKDFRCARIILGGVELYAHDRQRQMRDDGRGLSADQQFYLLAE